MRGTLHGDAGGVTVRRLLLGLLAEALCLVLRAAVCFGVARAAAFVVLLDRRSITLSASGLSLLLAAFLFAAWKGR